MISSANANAARSHCWKRGLYSSQLSHQKLEYNPSQDKQNCIVLHTAT